MSTRQKITKCECCGTFDCSNIDHNPYQTREYNAIASRWRDEAHWEEFYGKNGNGYMQDFHGRKRLALEKGLKRLRGELPKPLGPRMKWLLQKLCELGASHFRDGKELGGIRPSYIGAGELHRMAY